MAMLETRRAQKSPVPTANTVLAGLGLVALALGLVLLWAAPRSTTDLVFVPGAGLYLRAAGALALVVAAVRSERRR